MLAPYHFPGQPPAIDQGAIQAKLEQIFSREEFQERPPEGSNLLLKWLLDFFSWIGQQIDASPFLFWLMLIGSIVLLALLLWAVALSVFRVFHRDRLSRGGASGSALRKQLSAKYLEEAENYSQRREYTEAIRFLFLSLVYYYDENEQFVFQPALTNREYLAGFSDRPSLSQQLTRFVDVLDEHWYGMQPSCESTYLAYRQSFDQLFQRRGLS